MASYKLTVISFLLAGLVLVASLPTPGGHGGHHEHYVLHVPLKVDTIHHYSEKVVKVPVYHHHHHHTYHKNHAPAHNEHEGHY